MWSFGAKDLPELKAFDFKLAALLTVVEELSGYAPEAVKHWVRNGDRYDPEIKEHALIEGVAQLGYSGKDRTIDVLQNVLDTANEQARRRGKPEITMEDVKKRHAQNLAAYRRQFRMQTGIIGHLFTGEQAKKVLRTTSNLVAELARNLEPRKVNLLAVAVAKFGTEAFSADDAYAAAGITPGSKGETFKDLHDQNYLVAVSSTGKPLYKINYGKIEAVLAANTANAFAAAHSQIPSVGRDTVPVPNDALMGQLPANRVTSLARPQGPRARK
ncbi:hypothetical protein ACH4C6_34330 [Streptomyces sp. NPDC017943]|uniref:hypothetical protein n=1 Tax=Streptomyces sp. NPDC017943 TaxID=3365019 RepID=UPI0037A18459